MQEVPCSSTSTIYFLSFQVSLNKTNNQTCESLLWVQLCCASISFFACVSFYICCTTPRFNSWPFTSAISQRRILHVSLNMRFYALSLYVSPKNYLILQTFLTNFVNWQTCRQNWTVKSKILVHNNCSVCTKLACYINRILYSSDVSSLEPVQFFEFTRQPALSRFSAGTYKKDMLGV